MGTPVQTRVAGWTVTLEIVSRPAEPQGLGDGKFTAYFDPDSVVRGLSLRWWRNGDRFRPLGMGGDKKLQDFFTDAKVPQDWRHQVPLLVSDQRIAWVVGYRIANWARVRLDLPEGSPVLRVSFER